MPIPFRGGKKLTTTQLAKTVGSKKKPNWPLANWIKYHGKGVLKHGE